MEKLSAKAMKDTLWETLQSVKNKEITPVEADAIASQSREIVRVIRVQQGILRQASERVTEELIDYAKG